MSLSSRDVALAEKGLQELEALLELPKSNAKATAWSQPAKRCSDFLRPSIQNRGRTKSESSLSQTAYLDGLRGFAALLVYFLHHQVWGHSGVKGEFILENAFGWDKKYYFVCFPGILYLFLRGTLRRRCLLHHLRLCAIR